MGVMALIVAIVVAASLVLGKYPEDEDARSGPTSTSGDVRAMVARTELWLEAQRPALPAAGGRAWSTRSASSSTRSGCSSTAIDPTHPAAREDAQAGRRTRCPRWSTATARSPVTCAARSAPAPRPTRSSPKASARSATRSTASPASWPTATLDDLAIRTRYLDYKYGGEDVALPAPGLAAPDPSPDRSPDRTPIEASRSKQGHRLMRVAIPHPLDNDDVRRRLKGNSSLALRPHPGGNADRAIGLAERGPDDARRRRDGPVDPRATSISSPASSCSAWTCRPRWRSSNRSSQARCAARAPRCSPRPRAEKLRG